MMVSFIGGWFTVLLGSVLSLSSGAFFNNPFMWLSWNVILLLIASALSRTFYWLVLYPRLFTPFRHLPTPTRRWPLTGSQTSLFGEHPWDVARHVAETVPNTGLIRYYIGFSNERLLVTSPKAISDVLVQGESVFRRTDLDRFILERFSGNGLGLMSGEEHQIHKKILLSAFTNTHIRALIPTFWAKTTEMISGIEPFLELNTHPISLRNWGTRVTLDIIGVAGLGYDFGTLQNPTNELSRQYHKMLQEPGKAFSFLQLLANYVDTRVLLKVPIRKNIELNQGSSYLRRVARDIIRHRIQEPEAIKGQEKDIISVALASGIFSEQNLIDHVQTFIIAGHESSATAFEWTMFEIGKRPEMQTRLRDEIRAYIPSLHGNSDALLSRVIESMPYLNAVCSEILRFHAFLPLGMRVASKDTRILDTPVPKGTIVEFCAHATNHDKTLWGPDAEQFNPERWMAPKQSKSGGSSSNFALMTFSAGPKNCIGQLWARTELACLLAGVVGRFQVELVDPDATEVAYGKTMKLKKAVYARLKRVEGW